MSPPQVVAVLLAAGAARRFGSPKQLAELDGRPLVLHALDHLLDVPAVDEVVVVVGAHGDAVRAAIEDAARPGARVRVVACADWHDGLSASLRTGVDAAAAAGADVALVHLADLPRVTPDVIALVLDAALGAGGGGATRATYHGADGHPVVLARPLFGAIAALTGDAGARDLLARDGTRRIEAGHLADPADVDTPDQLEALKP